jgi:hypothetical protein
MSHNIDNNNNYTDDKCYLTGRFNDTTCANTGFWAYAFAVQYFVFLKLILLTLLYALFASTASKLQTETDNIWKFQRYILVIDFANRLPLPPPLSIIYYIYFVICCIHRTFVQFLSCCTWRKPDKFVSESKLYKVNY